MPTAVPDSNRGSNATITMSREDLMALSVKKLKHLLKERDLPAGHAAKSTLVDRLLVGKKKAPKSIKERVSAHRANRTEEQKKADRALNTEQVSAHRNTRSQAKVVAAPQVVTRMSALAAVEFSVQLPLLRCIMTRLVWVSEEWTF